MSRILERRKNPEGKGGEGRGEKNDRFDRHVAVQKKKKKNSRDSPASYTSLPSRNRDTCTYSVIYVFYR